MRWVAINLIVGLILTIGCRAKKSDDRGESYASASKAKAPTITEVPSQSDSTTTTSLEETIDLAVIDDTLLAKLSDCQGKGDHWSYDPIDGCVEIFS